MYRQIRVKNSINPIVHGGGGGGVPELILEICIFATNTATVMKFDDFS